MFDLPAGIMEVLPGGYKTGFSCEGRIYGYYADPFNDCQVFHVCVPPDPTKGNSKTLQYPFFCVKDTKFNQVTICDMDFNPNMKSPRSNIK